MVMVNNNLEEQENENDLVVVNKNDVLIDIFAEQMGPIMKHNKEKYTHYLESIHNTIKDAIPIAVKLIEMYPPAIFPLQFTINKEGVLDYTIDVQLTCNGLGLKVTTSNGDVFEGAEADKWIKNKIKGMQA
jgi:hypothetical protein